MKPPSRTAIVAAILRKDFTAYSRDRLWVILSALMLVLLIVVFWLLPATVDESVEVGIAHRDLGELADQLTAGNVEEGIRVVEFPSDEALRRSVGGEKAAPGGEDLPPVQIGLSFAPDFRQAVSAGRESRVTIYLDSGVPPEIRSTMGSFVRELAFSLAGEELPVTEPQQEEIILGEDRAGNQVSPREQLRPLFAFMVLLVESFALASLIAEEIQARTITALLVTPARTADVLAAKALMGTLLALGQALVFLLAVRAFYGNAGALLLAIVLGAVMAAAVGMIAGAAGKDFMGTIFYGVLFFIPLAIPAFGSLFPGSASTLVQVLPSYGVVETIVGATAYDEGWGALGPKLGMALAWDAALLGLGFFILKRKVETL